MGSTDEVQASGLPQPEAWQIIKPIFLDLYLRQGKTLDEVRAELETKHSFVASVKSYKLKVKQWGALKYRKRRRHPSQAAKRKTPSTSKIVSTNDPNLNHVAVSCKRRLLPSSNLASDIVYRFQDFESGTTRMTQQIHNHDSVTFLFSATQDFWLWTMHSNSSPKPDHNMTSHITPGLEMVNTAILLSIPASYQYGLSQLISVQEDIVSKIEASPAAAFVALITLYTYDKWHRYPRVQDVLFNFIKAHALRQLSAHHPLKQVLTHVTSDDMRRVAGKLAMIHIDTLENMRNEGEDVPNWSFYAPTIGLIQARLLKEANEVSNRRLQQAHTSFDRVHILGLIHRCQFYSCEYDACIATSESLLETALSLAADGEPVWGSIVGTYDVIAKCYAAKSDGGLTVKYCWLAFKTSLQQFGPNCTGSRYYHYELGRCLHLYRRWEDLKYLRSEYASMYPQQLTDFHDSGDRSKLGELGEDSTLSTDEIPKSIAYV